jgi:two-component system response regulator GlrR
MKNILVVDDDQNILKVIKMRLEASGYTVVTAAQAETAIGKAQEEIFNLALVDFKLPGKDGLYLMEELRRLNPGLPVIILTAYGTIDNAVTAMKKGAYNYMTKPFKHEELLGKIKNCLAYGGGCRVQRRPARGDRERNNFKNIIGKSQKIKEVLDLVVQAGKTDSNVYIEGESGTGKELIARTLHMLSRRKNGPFVAINSAAIPETLLESELFGYKRGAFTGAVQSKKGYFAQADKGTLFLDEISETSLPMQAKLLRVLEEKQFYPLGAGEKIKVDVRIIVALNKNIEDLIEKGDFREDLFYRIHVIPIRLPPLRERTEDIALLARHFLQKHAEKMKKDIQNFTESAMEKLLTHSWPGNIRELENTIECAVAMATSNLIEGSLVLRTQDFEKDGLKPFRNAKDDFERKYLIQLLDVTRGHVTRAAKLAGKYRADLYELLRKHGLDPSEFRKE